VKDAFEKRGYGYTKELASKGFDSILKPAAALDAKPQALVKRTYKMNHKNPANTLREDMTESREKDMERRDAERTILQQVAHFSHQARDR
jgi:hypothetical protein